LKLLFDQNLSPRLVAMLADLYPGSVHVRNLGLKAVDDRKLWSVAKADGSTVVTKDGDFAQLALLYGQPPKVIWLRIGNCTTADVERLIRKCQRQIADFDGNSEAALLALTA
jgi:predicted nuclease of predicted toxin-antitoxin system